MIAATTGSILVLMKKNSTSRVFLTGRSDSANAHGVASSSTRIVETIVANAELATYGHRPLANTALYCDSVGEKTMCGVLVYASASVLNEVSTIHSTGKKNTIPTTQPTMPQVRLLLRRLARGPVYCSGSAVLGGGDCGDVCAGHHAACSVPENEVKISRSANVATMIVATTTTTPMAAAWPTWKPRKARW